MRYLLLLLLLAQLSPGAASADEGSLSPLQPADIFELEWASKPEVSPDGEQIVYLRNSMDIMEDQRIQRLWLVGSTGKNHRKLTSNDQNESSPCWSPEGDRIAYVTEGPHGSEIHVQWLQSGQQARLTQLPSSPTGLAWSPDGRHIAFSMFVKQDRPQLAKSIDKPEGARWAAEPRMTTRVHHERDGTGQLYEGYRHLFVVAAEGGTARQVTSGDRDHGKRPQWMPDGNSLVFSANRNENWQHEYRNTEIYRVDLETNEITQLTDRYGPAEDPVVSPDGKQIAFVGREDRGQTYQVNQLYVMNADGSNVRSLTNDLDRNVFAPQWMKSPAEGLEDQLFVAYEESGVGRIARVSLDGQVAESHRQLGGEGIHLGLRGSYDVSGSGVVAFTRGTALRPAEIMVAKPFAESTRQVTHLNDDLLKHRMIGEVEEFWCESSADGRRVQAWIVRPPDFKHGSDKKYPLILDIHGGPISSWGSRFSAPAQLFAAAGYVVVYANPRGSIGYGEEFGNLLYHDFPGKDYDDLMSVVDAVVERGYVNEQELFVTGGSAGGTMTAWIVGNTDRFAAAAVVRPVVNWLSKTLVADNYFAYHNVRYPGVPWENPEGYLRDSPIVLAGKINTPTLVMVGTSDLRTPPSEAKQLYHALKLRKVETALLEYPGASHFLDERPSRLISRVANTLAWFEKYREAE